MIQDMQVKILSRQLKMGDLNTEEMLCLHLELHIGDS